MDAGAQRWPEGPSFLFLLLMSSLLICPTVQGAAHRFIQAFPKSDVLLPCEAPEGSNLDDLVLEWTRPDLQDYVFLFRGGRSVNNSQHPHFRNRVELIDPTLRSGNLTLKLHHVGPTDKGQYQCHVLFKSHAREKRSVTTAAPIRTVNLTVVRPDGSIKATPGSNVQLLCEAPEGSNLENVVLQWTRLDLDREYVFLFKDGRPLKNKQHPDFRNRVQLLYPTLDSRNFTLELHNVELRDNGLYQCRVAFKPHVRERRSVIHRAPIRTVDLTVVIQDGAIPFEAGAGFVATLFISLLLQIWEQ